MRRLSSLAPIGLFCVLSSIALCAQITPSSLVSFTDGRQPTSLIQAQDGNFYGTTLTGGSTLGQSKCFSTTFTASSTVTDVGCGTLFKLTPDGTLTTLYSFCPASTQPVACADGSGPIGLVQGADGKLYGTTLFGGSSVGTALCVDWNNIDSDTGNPNDIGCGTIFEISTSGQITTLYNFSGTTTDNGAAFPNFLVVGCQAGSGGTCSPTFYGTTTACNGDNSGAAVCPSSSAYGILFGLTPSQSTPFKLIASFNSTSLAYPNAVIQGSDGNLYGTTQLGGNITSGTGCLPVGSGVPAFGCGGFFELQLSNTSLSSKCTFAQSSIQSGGDGATPEVVRQPGRGFPGGNPWWSNILPILLVEGEGNTFYGTTPRTCLSNFNGSPELDVDQTCTSTPNNPSTIFQCTPSSSSLTTLYTFSGKASTDGGGSTTGLTLASDGNFYGLSGDFVFQITPKELLSLPLSSISPFYSDFTSLGDSPNSLIQGSDGNFYGTSVANTGGTVFEIKSAITGGPVTLKASPLQITIGSSAQLTWTVSNAFSMTAQRCYGFVQSGTSGAGTWTGPQTGALSNNTYMGSSTITPTQVGNYTYALTCGGIESGFASLTVMAPATLKITTTSLPTGTVGVTYPTATLAQTGGVGPYTWSLVSGSSLPVGLSLDPSTGTIGGIPLQNGNNNFSVSVTDSEVPAVTATASLSMTIASGLAITSSSLPDATVGVSYNSNLTATGGTPPYSWTLAAASSLPPGLNLATSGVVSGIPTQNGAFTFSVTAADSEPTPGKTTETVSITVGSASPPTIAANPTTITISAPGGSGTTTLTFSNFSSATFSVSCTNLPAEATCTTLNASGSTATLQISTTAPSSTMLQNGHEHWRGLAYAAFLPGIIGLILPFGCKKHHARVMAVIALLFVVSSLTACGGGTQSSPPPNNNPGTPAGQNTVTVTASAGSQSASTSITVNVQ